MKKYSTILALFSIMYISACSNPLKNTLVGERTAIAVSEEGSPLKFDYSEVKLNLRQDGSYEYFGTLNYKEEGIWHLKDRLLVTLDTLNDAEEKAVFIKKSNIDTLIIQMAENGKKREVVFVKN